jgi:hypothetical protein
MRGFGFEEARAVIEDDTAVQRAPEPKEVNTGIEVAYLDTAGAAKYVSISEWGFRNLLRLGRGPRSVSFGPRLRRFSITDLDAWAESRRAK